MLLKHCRLILGYAIKLLCLRSLSGNLHKSSQIYIRAFLIHFTKPFALITLAIIIADLFWYSKRHFYQSENNRQLKSLKFDVKICFEKIEVG